MTRARREDAPTTPADPAERAREIALRLLTHSARSCAQLREKLIARDVAPELADSLIARYVEVGLLDDAALAAQIARTRHAERGLAPRAIRLELQRKGFTQDDIAAALEPIPDSIDDRAHEIAFKRWVSLAGLDEEKRTRRVVGLLARKGYSPSSAFAVVKDWQRADKAGVD
ncbi:regulatory protein RecX [Demequina sp.]|uniref:regulatory protein RecX n=1 Tax=Demequina sp. TaxID=2050685 RepID=UPI003D0EF932